MRPGRGANGRGPLALRARPTAPTSAHTTLASRSTHLAGLEARIQTLHPAFTPKKLGNARRPPETAATSRNRHLPQPPSPSRANSTFLVTFHLLTILTFRARTQA